MKIAVRLIVCGGLLAALAAGERIAAGRGFGGARGGGGARPAGGAGAMGGAASFGGARPAGGYGYGGAPGAGFGGGFSPGQFSASNVNRSPSLSRSLPNFGGGGFSEFGGARSEFGAAAAPRSNFGTGSLGDRLPNSLESTLRGNPSSFERPSQGQLDSFLNMPRDGASTFSQTPSQLPAGDRTTTTTPGGATITRGDNGAVIRGDNGALVIGGGTATTPGGATVGGVGAVGIHQGPEGGVQVGGRGAIGATDGTNSAAVAGSFRGARGPGGGTAGSVSGIGAVNQGGVTNVAGGRAGGVVGPGGTAVGNAAGFRGTMQNGQFTGNVAGGSAVRGPYGNTWTNRTQAAVVNGQIVAGAHWNTVNGSYTHWGAFGPGWYARYPNVWWPGRWAAGVNVWAPVAWSYAYGYCGCAADPVYYDYGNDVSYQNDTVYYGAQPIAAADQYYQQARILAQRGRRPTTTDEWLPLGVFGVVTDGQSQAERVLQLAVNADGLIRGNFYDAVSDQTVPVYGAVDKPTQRVALMMEGNDALVLETGLYNLTNDEAPALLHFDATRREPRTLMRLQPPADGAAPPAN